jgi:single stranded DNA-binding protein
MLFGNYQNLAPYLRKGQQVAVEGKQQHKSYVDQQNVTKYISYIKVDNIELCGSKQEGQQNPSQQPQQSPVQQAPTQNNPVQNPVQQPQQNPSQDNISQFESQNDDLPF